MGAQRKLMIGSAIYSTLFAIAAFVVMFYHASHKQILIQDVAQDEGTELSGAVQHTWQQELVVQPMNAGKNCLSISVPAETRSEQVTIENHYMDHELWVQIDTVDAAYLAEHPVFVDGEIKQGQMQLYGGKLWLVMPLRGIREYRSVLEKGYLTIELYHPKEIYDKIVVIDPEADANALGIAGDLKELLDASDVKAYYSRMEAKDLTPAQRLSLCVGSDADIYIGIQMGRSEDETEYGTVVHYGGEFFSPEMDSGRLADLLERQVTTAISGKVVGIFQDEDDFMLTQAPGMAVVLEPGFVTNAQEKKYLKQKEYRRQIAQGIYETILQAYEQME